MGEHLTITHKVLRTTLATKEEEHKILYSAVQEQSSVTGSCKCNYEHLCSTKYGKLPKQPHNYQLLKKKLSFMEPATDAGYSLCLLQILHCRFPHLQFKMQGTVDPCHIRLCLQHGASITFATL